MKYAVISATVTDEIQFVDNSRIVVPGGAGIYALAGIKLWDDDVLIVTGIGEDYDELHGKWYRDNNLSMAGLKIKDKKSPYTVIEYFEDGEREETPKYGIEHFCKLETTAQEIKPVMEQAEGIYIFKNTDMNFWGDVLKFKKESKAKVMWEIAADATCYENLHVVEKIAKQMDAVSLNMTEAKNLFCTEEPQTIISNLQSWNVELIFLRRGAKGATMITPTEIVEVPSQPDVNVVDPTGGGNSSTGGVLCGLVEGYSSKVCGIMGSISAAMCISQHGVPEKITLAMREEAKRKAGIEE